MTELLLVLTGVLTAILILVMVDILTSFVLSYISPREPDSPVEGSKSLVSIKEPKLMEVVELKPGEITNYEVWGMDPSMGDTKPVLIYSFLERVWAEQSMSDLRDANYTNLSIKETRSQL